jgi:hypothetical protein
LLTVVTAPASDGAISVAGALVSQERIYVNLVFPVTTADSAKWTGGLLQSTRKAIGDLHPRTSITVLLDDSLQIRISAVEKFFTNTLNRKPRMALVAAAWAPGLEALASAALEPARLSSWRSAEEFYGRVEKSNCLNGRLQIHLDGSASACAATRRSCGTGAWQGLTALLRDGRLYNEWEWDKNRQLPCSECAIRFACDKCAALLSAYPSAVCQHAAGRKLQDCDWIHDGFLHCLRAGNEEGEPVCRQM